MISQIVVAFMMAAAAVTGADPAVQERQPTGKWIVNYDDAQCLALREYGTTEEPLTVVLKPSPLAGVMRLVVLRKGRSSAGQEDVTLQFGEGAPIKTSLLSYTDDGNHMRVVSVNVSLRGWLTGPSRRD